MSQQVLVIDPPNELKFKGFFEQGITTHMQIKNPTTNAVLFKIKTTAPKKYCVRPNSGLLDANDTVDIAITPQPVYVDPNEVYKHKFMVQSVVAPKGKFNADQVWKEVGPDQIMDLKLKCMFELPRGNNVSDSGDVGQTDGNKKLVYLLDEKLSAKKDGVEGPIDVKRKEEDLTASANAKTTPGFAKSENPQEELQKKAMEVAELRESESKLRHENLQLKEELLRLRQSGAGGRGEMRSVSQRHVYEKTQTSVAPWAFVAIAMAIIGMILGKFFM